MFAYHYILAVQLMPIGGRGFCTDAGLIPGLYKRAGWIPEGHLGAI